ncbi:uncharacterized protein LOC121875837 [Homarus americanus]|uniref:Putative 50S ribosome-binding GTPase-like 4 n=1 Tax=Homarus americanus TaxID=6706 RepID=A0A8J5NBL0_HOMAM|nr:uncharacterized protein LOC121875837 [Homarus americanus]KAG7176441.1 putative 50S ribosome-binding GTPase-like 4 [Homarus americanus]
MQEIELNSFIEENVVFDSEGGGLQRYNLQSTVKIRDEENKIRVLCVGSSNNKPSTCVLLLGETGAGKTTIVNAFVNFIFGVKFEDNFRIQVKDQIDSSNRKETESQTDYITVYVIYHQEGMVCHHNFIVIDTPGLADTRGMQEQGNVMDRLEMFLTSDFGIDELSCIGLVAKANTNRDFSFQKDILGEIISLLGNEVPEVTNLFATFAVEKPMVDQIVRNAGVQFSNMFELDNGVLYAPHKLSSSIHKRDRGMLSYRWENMIEQYERLFAALVNAPSVNVKLLREKKLLDKSLKILKVQVEDLAKLLTALEMNKKMLSKYELQEAKNREWRQERIVKRKDRLSIEEGFHAHNCPTCDQTCIFPCPPEKENSKAGFIGGIAGALGGSAAGAAAVQTTLNSAAVITRAATSTGFAASVGGWVTRALGGTVAASEIGAIGGVPGILVGGAVGITIGVVTGACCGKFLSQGSCAFPSRGDVCGERGCLHSLSQHIKEGERIREYNDLEVKINNDVKELFDVAVSKKADANVKISIGRQKILAYKKQVAQDTLQMLFHVKKIQEISLTRDPINPQDRLDKLIAEVRLGQPDHIHHAVGIIKLLKKAVAKLSTCKVNQLSDNVNVIMKFLENFQK